MIMRLFPGLYAGVPRAHEKIHRRGEESRGREGAWNNTRSSDGSPENGRARVAGVKGRISDPSYNVFT